MKYLLTLFLFTLTCSAQVVLQNATIQSAVLSTNGAAGGASTELADTFTDSDKDLSSHTTTTGGYSWTKVAGTQGITITSNAAVDNSASGTPAWYYVNHTISSADYTAQCDISTATPATLAEANLVIRNNGSSAGYTILWRPDLQQIRLFQGTTTELAQWNSIAGSSHTFKIAASGSTISLWVDSTLYTNITDSATSAAGYVAIGCGWRAGQYGSGITYDNLTVTVP